MTNKTGRVAVAAAAAAVVLAGCAGATMEALPRLAPAVGAQLQGRCADLAGRLAFPATAITAVNDVPAGTLQVAGKPVPRHCQVLGRMHERTSPVDGKRYAIGFELRLPLQWNGRFFYQGNGGTDGTVVPATGPVGGGGPLDHALNMGFAVLSSDGGHAGNGAEFGMDPQARLDFGYQAITKLTPLAKEVIRSAYGKKPDRSYFGGCSNGGRLAMVAMTRLPGEFDGFLAGDPQFRLPLAAINHLVSAQAYLSVATNRADIHTGFTPAERSLVSRAVLARCDALDGATDGLVHDTAACQAAFDLARDVPSCASAGARDGSCLSTAQKAKIATLFAGGTTRSGQRFYSSFPYDAGIAGAGWANTLFANGTVRSPGAVAFIWQVPPERVAGFDPARFVQDTDVDSLLAKMNATDATYTESAMAFSLPPHPGDVAQVRDRGGKILLYHGTSDSSVSSDDSVAWLRDVDARSRGRAADFARVFLVPGMNHCSGGPAADQFDMLSPLVKWVEQGEAPASVIARTRGAGNAGGVNTDLPAAWAPDRTRPLCPWPQVARYRGAGSLESASSFSCR